MNFRAIAIPNRIKNIVALILIVGFGAAIVIFVTATTRTAGETGYEPENSKQYLREMETYGGKANVLASDFRSWIAALWQGRNLAYTVAFLTILLALAVLFFAVPLPPADDAPDHGSRGHPGAETGNPPPGLEDSKPVKGRTD